MALYSLRKSRRIMKQSNDWYKKRGGKLRSDELQVFEEDLQALDKALLAGDREAADPIARRLETFSGRFSKTIFEFVSELGWALVIAVAVATIVRASWFEPFEIPTGSMRPTFEEQDHLTVTKTAFGINVPLMTKHFYFDPNLVQRAGVIIWSGDGVPNLDSESTFMGIFPYTKRYIKRCMGKPGDIVYFYGGKIYGCDRDGNDLVELRDDPHLNKIEHVPFIQYEGRLTATQDPKMRRTGQISFFQINQGIGRMLFNDRGEIRGEVFNGKEWVKDQPEAQKKPHTQIETYSDFWGIRNFAMARLLTKQQVENLHGKSYLEGMPEGKLYLELRHTPSLSFPPPLLSDRFGLTLAAYVTVMPLHEQHLKTLMDNMYTCRFVVKDGRADRYRVGGQHFSATSPAFPGLPDGTYEIYHGKAVSVDWGGITTAVPSDSPLYALDIANIQKLYNMGMEMSTIMEPSRRSQTLFPSRYAYFREGVLYMLGAPVMQKDDPVLVAFNARELKREAATTQEQPYVAFKDFGPPMKDGKLDNEFLKTFGYHLPDDRYLVLGDNHAMSQDSRYFGPIPQANIQGAPSLIVWPPGSRWGCPNQTPYPWITLPRLIVWGIALFIAGAWYLWHRYKISQPIFKKINF